MGLLLILVVRLKRGAPTGWWIALTVLSLGLLASNLLNAFTPVLGAPLAIIVLLAGLATLAASGRLSSH
jgi:hypothetical protein